VLSVVTSYCDGIDLPTIDHGFVTGRSNKEIDALEREAAPAPRSLARLISPVVMLQALEEEK
jgi:hypothetical protein